MRAACALIATMLVTGCVAPSGPRKPARPLQQVQVDGDTRQCVAELSRLRARYSLLPEQDFGNGCSIKGSVMLTAASVPVTNIKAIRCPLARALAAWVRDDVQTAARTALGSAVVRIDSMGAYSCRRIMGGNSSKLSEHATGNAVDIAGFQLADGRTVTVEGGWSGGSDAERRFLRAVRASACKRFQTVLSPDYNAAHYNHLHFDLGRGPYCR